MFERPLYLELRVRYIRNHSYPGPNQSVQLVYMRGYKTLNINIFMVKSLLSNTKPI